VRGIFCGQPSRASLKTDYTHIVSIASLLGVKVQFDIVLLHTFGPIGAKGIQEMHTEVSVFAGHSSDKVRWRRHCKQGRVFVT
jgi:hypothetical protein